MTVIFGNLDGEHPAPRGNVERMVNGDDTTVTGEFGSLTITRDALGWTVNYAPIGALPLTIATGSRPTVILGKEP